MIVIAPSSFSGLITYDLIYRLFNRNDGGFTVFDFGCQQIQSRLDDLFPQRLFLSSIIQTGIAADMRNGRADDDAAYADHLGNVRDRGNLNRRNTGFFKTSANR
jgi:hypothetical protein